MHEPGQVEITVAELDAGQGVVRVRGEVDLSSAELLEAALGERPSGELVVLDLTECTLLDSSAIRVVWRSAERARASGGAVSIVAVEGGIRRVLEIAGVDQRLQVHPTVEAAVLGASS